MDAHTQSPTNFLADGYAVLKMPVAKDELGTWRPKYESVFRESVPRKYYKYHYVQRYYTKGCMHYFWDKITQKHPQAFRFWIEVAFMRTAETAQAIEELLKIEDVELIDTPEKYRFDLK